MLDTHRCAVTGCREACPSSHLMCIRHWRMVPAALRRMVFRAYSAWRRAAGRGRSLNATRQRAEELRKAQQLAIAAVLEKEAKRDAAKKEGQEALFG